VGPTREGSPSAVRKHRIRLYIRQYVFRCSIIFGVDWIADFACAGCQKRPIRSGFLVRVVLSADGREHACSVYALYLARRRLLLSASKILALTSLFLATTFAQTEWKEFISSDGNFRVLFPDNPQQQTGTERNLHEFSATAGAESYLVSEDL